MTGLIEGPAMLAGVGPGESAADLESHYRYLSGLFLGIGLALLSCVSRIEARTERFRWAAGAVVLGGVGRLVGLALEGDAPSAPHLIGLAAELGLTPALVLWQARVARRWAAPAEKAVVAIPPRRPKKDNLGANSRRRMGGAPCDLSGRSRDSPPVSARLRSAVMWV